MKRPDAPARGIAVVRHGETDWNIGRRIQGRSEVPLNARGRAQARESAELLRAAGAWTRVVASPLGRAAETGRIIAAAIGLPEPAPVPDLIERDFGAAEELPVAEAEQRWPGLVIPDAETSDALARRGAAALTRLREEAPGSIAIAHGALMRAALAELSGAPVPRILNGEVWLILPVGGGATAIRRLGAPAGQHAL